MRKIVVSALMGCLILASLHFQPVRAADLYVSTSGTDSGNCTILPCKTITYALSQAGSGDTIHVAAGTYNTALGEDFPSGGFDIDFNLTLIGAGASTTIIDATGSGGAIFDVDDAIFNISGFTLMGAEGSGRPLWYEDGSSGTAENNIIRNNGGDGIHVHNITENGLTISGNKIIYNGNDGIGLDTDTENPIIITNNTISNNEDDGIDNEGEEGGAYPTITNNIITHSGDEGIQWWYDEYYMSPTGKSDSEKNDDEKTGKSDRIEPRRLTVFGDGEYDISYNDVWGNECDNYMDMDDLTGIDGNISEDPLFSGDFHLYCGSPAINAGDNQASGIPKFDLDGNSRIQDGIIDMGAYEGCVTEFARHPQLPSLLPTTQNHISEGNGLLKQTNDLLKQAQDKGKDCTQCEKMINEAKELLDKAKAHIATPIYANNLALQALEKLKQAIDCLKALLG